MSDSIFKNLSWGVDGYGDKHYDCKFCGKYFGKMKIDKAFDVDDTHDCQEVFERSLIEPIEG